MDIFWDITGALVEVDYDREKELYRSAIESSEGKCNFTDLTILPCETERRIIQNALTQNGSPIIREFKVAEHLDNIARTFYMANADIVRCQEGAIQALDSFHALGVSHHVLSLESANRAWDKIQNSGIDAFYFDWEQSVFGSDFMHIKDMMSVISLVYPQAVIVTSSENEATFRENCHMKILTIENGVLLSKGEEIFPLDLTRTSRF